MLILFTDLNFGCGIFICLIIIIKYQADLKPIIYVVLAIAFNVIAFCTFYLQNPFPAFGRFLLLYYAVVTRCVLRRNAESPISTLLVISQTQIYRRDLKFEFSTCSLFSLTLYCEVVTVWKEFNS